MIHLNLGGVIITALLYLFGSRKKKRQASNKKTYYEVEAEKWMKENGYSFDDFHKKELTYMDPDSRRDFEKWMKKNGYHI